VVGAFQDAPGRYDYLGNLHPASYPDGNDVEVMRLEALQTAHREARRPHEREHTTPFLWDQPERFRIGKVGWETGLDASMTHRLTVDYPEDYALVREVYDALYVPWAAPFSLPAILDFLHQRPDIFALNRHLAGINWYRHCLGQLRTVSAAETVLG
jgi:spore coat polysaccharide biosynthesis protein SpsF